MTPETSPGPSLDDAAITAFLHGRNGQPHDLLGHHIGPGGLTITAYRPYATRVGARLDSGERVELLHVRDGNDGAHRLYRRIGYETRRQVVVAVLRWDGG